MTIQSFIGGHTTFYAGFTLFKDGPWNRTRFLLAADYILFDPPSEARWSISDSAAS